MFDGVDRVDTGTFLCPNCRGQVFDLFDGGTAGALMRCQMRCVACGQTMQRPVLPSMNEQAGGDEVPAPPGAAANQLWCDTPVPRSQGSPQGLCWGLQFRVLERGNELFSRCVRCGRGDSLGMINPAIG